MVPQFAAPLLVFVFAWVEIVVAGAIRSVGHIIDYTKKKKARKAAYKERQKETLAKRAAASQKVETDVSSGQVVFGSGSSTKPKIQSSPNILSPVFVAIAIVAGALLLKKR
jgi:hypothetical protein